MLSKPKTAQQTSFFLSLEEQLNHQHPLYLLANTIDWRVFETAFSKHYSATMGKPSKAHTSNGFFTYFKTIKKPE